MDLTREQLAAVQDVSAPGMTPGGGARRFRYNREPYGRATIPTALGSVTVDGKVMRTEDGPLVNFWRDCGALSILDVFIPAAWVEPIPWQQSRWVRPYDHALRNVHE